MCTYVFIYWHDGSGHPFQLYLPTEGTPPLIMGHVCGLSAWSSLNQFLHQRPQSQKKFLSSDVPKQRALTILSFSFSGHWAWNCENNLCINHFPHSSLMSRIERKYLLSSTSYLAGLCDIFSISSYLTELCVFSPMRRPCEAYYEEFESH